MHKRVNFLFIHKFLVRHEGTMQMWQGIGPAVVRHYGNRFYVPICLFSVRKKLFRLILQFILALELSFTNL